MPKAIGDSSTPIHLAAIERLEPMIVPSQVCGDAGVDKLARNDNMFQDYRGRPIIPHDSIFSKTEIRWKHTKNQPTTFGFITITTKLLSGADVNQNNENAKTPGRKDAKNDTPLCAFAPLRYTLEILDMCFRNFGVVYA